MTTHQVANGVRWFLITSWYKLPDYIGLYCVCLENSEIEEFFDSDIKIAVVDDFGNLVRVS